MRVNVARFRNYHCLHDLTVEFDDVTSLIGPNDTGKSSVLRALDWFFNGSTALSEKDLSSYADPDDRVIEVEVTFTDFTPAEREAIGDFYLPADADSLTVCRSWQDGTEDATCIVRTYPPFTSVRFAKTSATTVKAYKQLQEAHSELVLPAASSKPKVMTALRDWEQEHPHQLVTQSVDASGLIGPKGVIAKLFEYVFASVDMRAREEAREAKGSLLSQLAGGIDKKEFEERIQELDVRIKKARDKILGELNEKADAVARELSREVSGLCSGREISIDAEPKALRPGIELQLRVKHGNAEVDLDRQGHGFQRATMLAALLHLANRDAAEGRHKSLMLAVEEPEIYQNPIQSRRLARALQERAEKPGARLSVLYATHSPIFISPLHPERVRRLSRPQREKTPKATSVSSYSFTALENRVSEDHVPHRSLRRQVRAVMNEAFTEAFFAEAVILVEGETDKAVLDEVIGRGDALERYGITVASASGKGNLITAQSILEQLGIPSLTVFDSDIGNPARRREEGKEQEAADELKKGGKLNRALLAHHKVLNEPHYPKGHLGSTLFAWDDNLENVLETTWPDWAEKMKEVRSELDDFKTKRPALYRLTAMRCADPIGDDLAKIVGVARGLVDR